MLLQIKNMVCDRCKLVVKTSLTGLGLNPVSVELGEVMLDRDLTDEQRLNVAQRLSKLGFELLENKKAQIVNQIKTAIIQRIQYDKEPLRIPLSTYLSEQLETEYVRLSTVFSEIEGNTIEKYFIAQKIEKVKEMLTYGELTLSEIALSLDYSSVAHLSAQFKKVTGLTPTAYKMENVSGRTSLDRL